ncbi:MAG: class II fructose-bisphosphate aldolase [Candidatus Nitrospinota bacterium M3_3B_026]
MKVNSSEELKKIVEGCAKVGDSVEVTDPGALRSGPIDKLVYNAVFGPTPEIRGMARWMIRGAAESLGIWPASIQGLYEAMGRGEASGYTVPAVNLRGMTYDAARALIRTALKNNTGPFIFEIARSEVGYTKQRPGEYAAVVIAAAVKEGWEGPVFIQGDHFQVNAKKHQEDPEKEVQGAKDLIKEAIEAGFYNIDIDTSTLVDLSKPTLDEQQKLNYEIGARLNAYVRELEPSGVTVSVGGEIGEVGEKNSTVEELDAYMEGYRREMDKLGGIKGISKVSVQTGTSHGGVPLPDGSIAEVALDFDTLDKLSHRAREKYGLAGAVQHGASTLPDDAFHHFPETTTAEIHLATGFQNIIYDSESFPADLREEIYKGLHESFAAERKEGQTEEQFIYKTRKKGFGLAKEEIWTLPEKTRNAIAGELEGKFDFLFKKLKAVDNREDVGKYITHPRVSPSIEKEISWA